MAKIKIEKYLIVFISCLLSLVSFSVSADTVEDHDFTYLFHLFYDNGKLFADRDFEFKYDVVPEKYVAETATSQFMFKGEIANLKGETAATFQFDPRRGNTNFTKGKVSIRAPYVPDGQKAVFSDPQGKILLTIFVSDSSFCNDDGACNFDRGESNATCPNDCGPLVTPPPSGGGSTGTGVEGKGGFNPLLLAGLTMAIAAASGWYGWRWWKKRKINGLPPVMPPSSLNP